MSRGSLTRTTVPRRRHPALLPSLRPASEACKVDRECNFLRRQVSKASALASEAVPVAQIIHIRQPQHNRSQSALALCGAMASDPLAAILLLGLWLTDFSMEAAAIPEIKEALVRVTKAEAEAVALEALASHTAEEVEHAMAEAFAPRLYDLLAGEQDA